jgi:hypothetical protein
VEEESLPLSSLSLRLLLESGRLRSSLRSTVRYSTSRSGVSQVICRGGSRERRGEERGAPSVVDTKIGCGS